MLLSSGCLTISQCRIKAGLEPEGGPVDKWPREGEVSNIANSINNLQYHLAKFVVFLKTTSN